MQLQEIKRPDFLSADLWEPRGSRFAPKLTLPDNRIFATVRKLAGVVSTDIIGRAGATAVMDVDAPNEARHLWLKSELFASTGKRDVANLTASDIERIATSLPICALEGNEFGEGPFAMYPHDCWQLTHFYKVRKQFIESKGKEYMSYGLYGTFAGYQQQYPWRLADGGTGKPTHEVFRQIYSNPKGCCAYFGEQVQYVGCNVKDYTDLPDYRKTAYAKHHAIRVMGRGMGKRGGIGPGLLVYFDWGNVEGLDGGYELHNGLLYERDLPDGSGTVLTSVHPKVDYNFQVQRILFNGFLLSDGYVTFDTGDLHGTNPNLITSLNEYRPDRANVVRWKSKNGAQAPVSKDGQFGYFEEPCRWHDAGFEAAYLYAQTAATEGQPWRDIDWRYEGDENWHIARADESGVLDAAEGHDPILMGRFKNRTLHLAAGHPDLNPWENRKLVARFAGQEVGLSLRGMKANLFTATL